MTPGARKYVVLRRLVSRTEDEYRDQAIRSAAQTVARMPDHLDQIKGGHRFDMSAMQALSVAMTDALLQLYRSRVTFDPVIRADLQVQYRAAYAKEVKGDAEFQSFMRGTAASVNCQRARPSGAIRGA